MAVTSLLVVTLVGCARSHDMDDRRDAAPSCGDEPAAPECERLCNEACEAFASCGGDYDACLEGCEEAYACLGETPGHDAAICGSDGYEHTSCEDTCRWVGTYGGYGSGPSCGETPDAGPADGGPETFDAGSDAGSTSCRGRDYCDCTDGCEPLIDLTPGCLCRCEEPFNCSGDTCGCFCGGAEYLGCAPVDACEQTEVRCDDPDGATLVDGCPVCPG